MPRVRARAEQEGTQRPNTWQAASGAEEQTSQRGREGDELGCSQRQPDPVLLTEGSRIAFKSCFFCQCIQYNQVDMT